MIRPTKLEDKAALLTVANAIGFQPDELEALSKMLADYLSDSRSQLLRQTFKINEMCRDDKLFLS
jgi:hypothetical protein